MDGISQTASQGQKRKRDKYVESACTECKRRKIKCNGEIACERCTNLSLECVYKPKLVPVPSDTNTASSTIQTLQDQLVVVTKQLDTLQQTVNYLVDLSRFTNNGGNQQGREYRANSAENSSESNADEPQPTTRTSYVGPLSFRSSLSYAKKSLANMGIDGKDYHLDERENPVFTAVPPSVMLPKGTGSPVLTKNTDQTPDSTTTTRTGSYFTRNKAPESLLLSIKKEDAFNLIDFYAKEVNAMYLVMSMPEFKEFFEPLWEEDGTEAVDNYTSIDICLIKMVLAISMSIEERKNNIAKRLYEQVSLVMDRKILNGRSDMDTLFVLVLIHIYQFHIDSVPQAYRTIGLAARMCNELGLHSREEVEKVFPNPGERCFAIRLFWVVYVLDRKLALNMGLPFSLRDDELDQDMPSLVPNQDEDKKDDHEELILDYLKAMITYSQLYTKVWSTASRVGSTTEANRVKDPQLDIQELDILIDDWQKTLPGSLRHINITYNNEANQNDETSNGTSLWIVKLQVLLFAQANQMKMQILRPFLLSSVLIKNHISYATRAVDLAKDTIRVLNNLHKTTTLYTTGQVHFNHFLISSLMVLFIAIIHDPKTFCGPHNCRLEFDMAIDLVKVLKEDSSMGKKLWSTIRNLKDIARKISGLNETSGVNSAYESDSERPNPQNTVPKNLSRILEHIPLSTETQVDPYQRDTTGTGNISGVHRQDNDHFQQAPQNRRISFSAYSISKDPQQNHSSLGGGPMVTPSGQNFDISTELNEIYFLATTGNNIGADDNGYLLNNMQIPTTWAEGNAPRQEEAHPQAFPDISQPFGLWPDEDLARTLGQWL